MIYIVLSIKLWYCIFLPSMNFLNWRIYTDSQSHAKITWTKRGKYTHSGKIRQPDDYRLAGPSALRSSESQDISTPGVTTAAVVFWARFQTLEKQSHLAAILTQNETHVRHAMWAGDCCDRVASSSSPDRHICPISRFPSHKLSSDWGWDSWKCSHSLVPYTTYLMFFKIYEKLGK